VLKADLGEIVILRDHITEQDTKIASPQARFRAPPKIMDNNVIGNLVPSLSGNLNSYGGYSKRLLFLYI
jgi:hypothetical protein